MAESTQVTNGSAIDRSERPGYVGLLLALGGVFVAAFAGLSFVSNEQAQPMILGLLAVLAMIGVFFVFAIAIGAVRFAGAGTRNDLTKIVADTAADGLLVVEDSGRIIYANERYLRFSGAEKGAEPKPVERLFTGGPEISEAVYRLAQAAREGRPSAEELRLSPALGGGREFGWYRLRVRPVARAGSRAATLWTISDVTQDRERHESVFQELQHAIDYLDHAPAGFLSTDRSGSIAYMNATLAEWLGYDLAKVGSGGLKLPDIMPDAVVAMLISASGAPGESRTETLDLDLRRRQGGSLPVRLYHRVAFGPDGKVGPSRTLVLNRSPGAELEDGQRAAEVRFARFFNSSPLAIATLDGDFRIVGSNPSFLKLFGTQVGSGGASSASVLDLVSAPERAALEAALAGTA
ncbi:MAG: hybrid sensor histidine kinase/response regulator, partial [Enterovirga sp.]|nr:hybrid sensor histidine kinase/response regulator [Enterovirga sp.]